MLKLNQESAFLFIKFKIFCSALEGFGLRLLGDTSLEIFDSTGSHVLILSWFDQAFLMLAKNLFSSDLDLRCIDSQSSVIPIIG